MDSALTQGLLGLIAVILTALLATIGYGGRHVLEQMNKIKEEFASQVRDLTHEFVVFKDDVLKNYLTRSEHSDLCRK